MMAGYSWVLWSLVPSLGKNQSSLLIRTYSCIAEDPTVTFVATYAVTALFISILLLHNAVPMATLCLIHSLCYSSSVHLAYV